MKKIEQPNGDRPPSKFRVLDMVVFKTQQRAVCWQVWSVHRYCQALTLRLGDIEKIVTEDEVELLQERAKRIRVKKAYDRWQNYKAISEAAQTLGDDWRKISDHFHWYRVAGWQKYHAWKRALLAIRELTGKEPELFW